MSLEFLFKFILAIMTLVPVNSVTINNQQGVTGPMVLWASNPYQCGQELAMYPQEVPQGGVLILLPSDCNLTSVLKGSEEQRHNDCAFSILEFIFVM